MYDVENAGFKFSGLRRRWQYNMSQWNTSNQTRVDLNSSMTITCMWSWKFFKNHQPTRGYTDNQCTISKLCTWEAIKILKKMKHKKNCLGGVIQGVFVLGGFCRGIYVQGVLSGGICPRTLEDTLSSTRHGVRVVNILDSFCGHHWALLNWIFTKPNFFDAIKPDWRYVCFVIYKHNLKVWQK